MTELDVKLAPVPIPAGCICSYTWGADGSPVRNGAMESCPAGHGPRFAAGGIVGGATLTTATCPNCGDKVPVECGDVTGMTLNDMMAAARSQASADCPGAAPLPHETVRVGAFAGEPVLTPETARALLRECVTVVKPGEMLVVRAPDWWTPGQAGEYQQYAQAVAGDAFRVLVVLGEELAIAEPEQAPAKRESD
jgi:hypothetical protein